MPACPICQTENASDTLLCVHCRAPLGVVRLGDLDAAQLAECRAALFDVLAQVARAGARRADTQLTHDAALWRRYLSAFWLRPETALWLYTEATALRSLVDVEAGGPWLDIGCGDGIHTALYHGWEFGPAFDGFQGADPGAADVYGQFEAATFDAGVARRGAVCALGVDLKEAALARAAALGAFERVERGDATALPIADASVATVYSNMLGQLGERVDAGLAEAARVLKPGGALVLAVLGERFGGALHFWTAAERTRAAGDDANATRLARLDRGRHAFEIVLPESVWRARLEQAGLRLSAVRHLLSDAAVRFWDTGLRAFSPALIDAVRRWRTAGVLNVVKPALVGGLAFLMEPLLGQLETDGPGGLLVLRAERL